MLKEIDQSYDIIIPFYLNVVQALAVFGNKGYIRGIEEIGYIYGAFKEKIPEINKIIFPEQEFTHEIGINLRKALLIDAIIL